MKPRDYAYEALAEVTATDMSAGRGELNAALKSIREQSDIEDSYLLADEIHERAVMYRAAMPEVMLTPSALAKHWLRVQGEAERTKPKSTKTNLHASATECATCGGDRFVVVAVRPAQQSAWMRERGIVPSNEGIEEYAPCPDCGPDREALSVRRPDGTVAIPPDPARIRDVLRS